MQAQETGQPPPPRPSAVLLNIQVLRALAAFMVVFHHCSVILPGGDAGPWRFGASGVDIFFVISGFIMVHTTKPGTTPGAFFLNRYLRIAPLYYLVTLAAFAVAAVAPSLMGSTRADLGELVKSLLFIPYVKGSALVQPLLFVGWTLNLEMMFYAVFALSLFTRRWSFWAASIPLVAIVALHPLARDPVAAFVTNPLILEFVGGMALARLRPAFDARLAVAAIAIGLALFPLQTFLFPEVPAIAVKLPAALLVVAGALALEARGKVVTNPLLLLLGDASYALYLTHPFGAIAVTKLLRRLGPGLDLVILPIAFIVTGIVAIVVHMGIERPITRRLRRLVPRPDPALSAEAAP